MDAIKRASLKVLRDLENTRYEEDLQKKHIQFAILGISKDSPEAVTALYQLQADHERLLKRLEEKEDDNSNIGLMKHIPHNLW